MAWTTSEWDTQFIKGLAQKGFVDFAKDLYTQLDKTEKDPQAKAKYAVAVAVAILDAAEAAAGQPMEDQLKLVAEAELLLKEAAAANPETAKSADYITEASKLKQRQATIRAARFAEVPDNDKEKAFKECDILFGEAEAGFEKIIQELNKEADKISADGANKDAKELERIEKQIDDIYFKVSEFHLRIAMCLYSHLDLYDNKPNDAKRKEIVRKLQEKLEQVAFEGEETSLITYAHYYTGMLNKKEKQYDKAEESFDKVLKVPRDLQVPELVRRTHFELADTRIKAEKFQTAIDGLDTLISSFKSRKGGGGDEEVRAQLYKATALFAFANKLKGQIPEGQPLPDAAKKLYDKAMEIVRTIQNTDPKWAGTIDDILMEWSKKIFPGSKDPTILMADGRTLYDARNYIAAAPNFRDVLMNTKAPEKVRVQGGYYLSMCYYHTENYYDAYVSADWVVGRFDAKKYPQSQKCLTIEILSLKKQMEKTNDQFDKGLYIKTRKQLGEEEFLLIEAGDLVAQGKLDGAIGVYERITTKAAAAYDSAQYQIALCTDQLADKLLKEKKTAQGVEKRAKALKLYAAFIEWAKTHPAAAENARQRQDLLCRSIHKIGRLLLDNTAENHYRAEIKRAGREPAAIAQVMKSAAEAMLQPTPDKMPGTAKDADGLLDSFATARLRKFIALSADIKKDYSDAVEIHPYVIHLRTLALVRLNDLAAAEKELEELKEYTDFPSLAEVYCKVAIPFDTQARELDATDKKKADAAFAKALGLFRESLKADPKLGFLDGKQRFQMFYYIVDLADKRGDTLPVDEKMALVKSFLEAYEGDKSHENDVDNVKRMHAESLLKISRAEDAMAILEPLAKKYDEAFAAALKTNPNAPLSARHLDSRKLIGKARKAVAAKTKNVQMFGQARNDFLFVRQNVNVPVASPDWWEATYNSADCMAETKAYEDVMKMLTTTFLLHPDMGGPDWRAKILLVLGKIAGTTFKPPAVDYSKQAAELMGKINKAQEESK